MAVIDFHTHIWPDTLAPRAVGALTETAGNIFTPVTDGTAAGLVAYMKATGIAYSVVLPVITKEKQAFTTNTWAASLPAEHPELIPFGSAWPHGDSWKEHVDQAYELGLKGIKFHPEYQQFQVDDEQFFPMYDYILSKGMHIIFHAGFDPGYKPPYHSSPKQFARVIAAVKPGVAGGARAARPNAAGSAEYGVAGARADTPQEAGCAYMADTPLDAGCARAGTPQEAGCRGALGANCAECRAGGARAARPNAAGSAEYGAAGAYMADTPQEDAGAYMAGTPQEAGGRGAYGANCAMPGAGGAQAARPNAAGSAEYGAAGARAGGAREAAGARADYATLGAGGARGSIILAHLGSSQMWAEVEQTLAGLPVYLDTSMGFSYYDREQFLRIAAKHGTDRLLFATDSPWSNAADEIKALKALAASSENKTAPLTASDIDKILSGNARALLF